MYDRNVHDNIVRSVWRLQVCLLSPIYIIMSLFIALLLCIICVSSSPLSLIRQDFDSIAIPRIVGTEGHANVSQYLQDVCKNSGFRVELDTFTQDTPTGEMEFTNIICTLRSSVVRGDDDGSTSFTDTKTTSVSPLSSNTVILAAHYDSKVIKAGKSVFIGATDSAVPCALLCGVMRSINTSSPLNYNLVIVFFDGEEAFGQWSSDDSLYGSRHLHDIWRDDGSLSKISVLVLLDLLGGGDIRAIHSHYARGQKYYDVMKTVEQSLGDTISKSSPWFTGSPLYQLRAYNGDEAYDNKLVVDDDHAPFLRSGVPVLHIIPTPFPSVWHTMRDDKSNISWRSVLRWSKLMNAFVSNVTMLM